MTSGARGQVVRGDCQSWWWWLVRVSHEVNNKRLFQKDILRVNDQTLEPRGFADRFYIRWERSEAVKKLQGLAHGPAGDCGCRLSRWERWQTQSDIPSEWMALLLMGLTGKDAKETMSQNLQFKGQVQGKNTNLGVISVWDGTNAVSRAETV